MDHLAFLYPTFSIGLLKQSHHPILLSTITFATLSFSQKKEHHVQHSNGRKYNHVNLQENCLSILKNCHLLPQVLQVHAHALRTSLFQLPIIQISLLSIATRKMKDIDMNYLSLVFNQIAKPTNSMYKLMIRGYANGNVPEKAIFFYRQMKRREVHPDAFASSFVLKSCSRISALFEGQQIHAGIVKDGYEPDGLLMTTLMDLYGRCRLGDDAHQLFDEMPNRDVVSWNVLISCFLQNKCTRDALGLFLRMMSFDDASQRPDHVTCLLTLSACANLGALDVGESVRRYAEDCGFDDALNIKNSLIDMYAKCGCLDKALELFDKTIGRNVVTWTTMISALAMHGQGRLAIEAFQAMERSEIQPDVQTFTAVLSACSHAGLVDAGRKYFNMMVDFGIKPTIHHYGCMVDLLGRAGLLEDAYGMIMSMDAEPDQMIWRTLLGACRIHGNVSLGQQVITHLINMKAYQAGDYVLLSNIHAARGNWDGVAQLRRVMKDEAIMTTPGCSTIQLNGKFHDFVVDDDSHIQTKEIFAVLDELNMHLKSAGYVASSAAK
ncbi:Pentatricopeptide repeat-containing protein [Nymphaea thermarum]|nr:Pentatricopeptide repeat-containing protein [Nymphaea thermarum]